MCSGRRPHSNTRFYGDALYIETPTAACAEKIFKYNKYGSNITRIIVGYNTSISANLKRRDVFELLKLFLYILV